VLTICLCFVVTVPPRSPLSFGFCSPSFFCFLCALVVGEGERVSWRKRPREKKSSHFSLSLSLSLSLSSKKRRKNREITTERQRQSERKERTKQKRPKDVKKPMKDRFVVTLRMVKRSAAELNVDVAKRPRPTTKKCSCVVLAFNISCSVTSIRFGRSIELQGMQL